MMFDPLTTSNALIRARMAAAIARAEFLLAAHWEKTKPFIHKPKVRHRY
jgi:hypothetical protein